MTTVAVSSQPTKPRHVSGVLRNLTSNWASIVVSILLSFVIAPLTVNTLGNVYYGIWTLLMQFTGYLWLLDFGVRESVVKYVAQYHASDERDELVSTVQTAVSLYSIVAAITVAAVALLALALPYLFNIPAEAVATGRLTAVLTGLTIALSFVMNVFVGVLMGLQKFYLMSRLGIVFAIVRAAVIYVLLKAGYGIVALAVIQLAVSVVSNALVMRWCFVHLPYLSIRLVKPGRAAALKLLNYGKYVLVSNIGDKLIFATDSIVIGIFMPVSMLTFYAIGGSLIEYLRSFMASSGVLLNPLSSSLEAKKQADTLGLVYMTGTKVSVLLGLPVCIGFIVLGERFISLWMGPDYGALAGLVLAVLTVGHLFGLPYYTISGVLYGLGQHQILATTRIFEAVANLVLSIVLIQWYGLVGVALGTVIPHVIVVVGVLPALVPNFLPASRKEYYMSTYVRPLVASVPFWVVCWLIRTELQPASLASFMGYVALALPAYLVPCWFLTLSTNEQSHVRHVVMRRLQPA